MKKNNLYIFIGLAAVGGFYYYMKQQEKKKQQEKNKQEEKIIEPVVIEKQEPNPLKSLVKAVKKISKPKAKPAQVTVQQTDIPFDPLGFQSNVVNKEFLQKVKSGKVKKEKYNFPFLKPKTIKGLPDFF
jgi:hypothetical protein